LIGFEKYLTKPELYAPGTDNFWDDEHISKGLLEAHLDPDLDAATRKHDFLNRSVDWISKVAPPSQYRFLLDLGCGPGLYAERFSRAGYIVTGVDMSRRSIAYAKEQSLRNGSRIDYLCRDYLSIDYVELFDVVTLIYCDYGALSRKDRIVLLEKVYQALKPGGKFIFDVFTPQMRKKESRSWHFSGKGGFWSEKPYLCLEAVYQYDDEDSTELRRYIVMTEDAVKCYNIWDHFFTREALLSEARGIGFNAFEFYGDVAGKEYSDTGETICGVYTR